LQRYVRRNWRPRRDRLRPDRLDGSSPLAGLVVGWQGCADAVAVCDLVRVGALDSARSHSP